MLRNLEQRVLIKANIACKIIRMQTTKEGTKTALCDITSTEVDDWGFYGRVGVFFIILARNEANNLQWRKNS